METPDERRDQLAADGEFVLHQSQSDVNLFGRAQGHPRSIQQAPVAPQGTAPFEGAEEPPFGVDHLPSRLRQATL